MGVKAVHYTLPCHHLFNTTNTRLPNHQPCSKNGNLSVVSGIHTLCHTHIHPPTHISCGEMQWEHAKLLHSRADGLITLQQIIWKYVYPFETGKENCKVKYGNAVWLVKGVWKRWSSLHSYVPSWQRRCLPVCQYPWACTQRKDLKQPSRIARSLSRSRHLWTNPTYSELPPHTHTHANAQ